MTWLEKIISLLISIGKPIVWLIKGILFLVKKITKIKIRIKFPKRKLKKSKKIRLKKAKKKIRIRWGLILILIILVGLSWTGW